MYWSSPKLPGKAIHAGLERLTGTTRGESEPPRVTWSRIGTPYAAKIASCLLGPAALLLRIASGREVERVRAEGGVDDRAGAALLDLRPRAPGAAAVAARPDLRGAAALVEQDGHRLPVPLVRLPVVRALGHERAPEVVRVEEPVLERDALPAPEDRPVDHRRRRLVGIVVALQRREPVTRPARANVVAAPGEVRVREEALDRRRCEALRRVEHDDGLVPLEQLGRRQGEDATEEQRKKRRHRPRA